MSELNFFVQIVKNLFIEFDQSLLTSKVSPFLGLTYIKIFPGKNHEFSSHHLYIFEPSSIVPQTESSLNLYHKSQNLFLNFINQTASVPGPLQDQNGYANGIGIGNYDVLIITIIADPEDYHFLYKSILNKIHIATSNLA